MPSNRFPMPIAGPIQGMPQGARFGLRRPVARPIVRPMPAVAPAAAINAQPGLGRPLGSFKRGGKVKKTGVYKLEKGERVTSLAAMRRAK